MISKQCRFEGKARYPLAMLLAMILLIVVPLSAFGLELEQGDVAAGEFNILGAPSILNMLLIVIALATSFLLARSVLKQSRNGRRQFSKQRRIYVSRQQWVNEAEQSSHVSALTITARSERLRGNASLLSGFAIAVSFVAIGIWLFCEGHGQPAVWFNYLTPVFLSAVFLQLVLIVTGASFLEASEEDGRTYLIQRSDMQIQANEKRACANADTCLDAVSSE